MDDGAVPLDRVPRMRERRRERLVSLLPRIYATHPENSVMGRLLDGLAGRLAELDEALERALRDRWVAFAGGTPPWSGGAHPLERLGLLVDVSREAFEDPERFRRRLRQLAPVLVHGTTTPRALLTVAAASMDLELCRRVMRQRDGTGHVDTSLGLGVTPGTVARCPGCQHPEGGSCIQDVPGGPIQARMLLKEGPVTPERLRARDLTHGSGFRSRNRSLCADRPVVTLTAIDKATLPVLRSPESRDVMLFVGTVDTGEVLTVFPRRDEAEVAPFQGQYPEGPALQFLEDPAGHAFLLKKDGRRDDVSHLMYFLHGDAYDMARFAEDKTKQPAPVRCAMLARDVMTPRMEVGEQRWQYVGYTFKDVMEMVGELGEEQKKELEKALKDAPTEPSAGKVELLLEWWTREPCGFRLRIPQLPEGKDAKERDGVRELIRRQVAVSRAAGVRAWVDFPESLLPEQHESRESALAVRTSTLFERETQPSHESLKVTAAARQPGERQPQQERRFSIQARFDVTRLDMSHLESGDEEEP